MKYHAKVRLDVANMDNNEYQKLIAAFLEEGWEYAHTSAVSIETNDLGAILKGMELCARQLPFVGDLSAISFDVQGFKDGPKATYAAAKNHPNAVADICKRSLP